MAVSQARPWGAYVDPPLRGKVAIVTGAAKGLGGAITDVLACDGAHIVLAGRDVEALETWAAQLEAEYPAREGVVVRCDVTSEADCGDGRPFLVQQRHRNAPHADIGLLEGDRPAALADLSEVGPQRVAVCDRRPAEPLERA